MNWVLDSAPIPAATITGIRFYKASANTGTHVGTLWTSTGTPLATATFAGETASGWQKVTFSTPVAITANTAYIASYHTSTGYYSHDSNYFTSQGTSNPPLQALANHISAPNGVYAYGATGSFPTQGGNGSNYWVDVSFGTGQSDATPPTVTAFTIPATSATLAVSISSFTASDNVAVAGYLLSESAAVPLATATGWSATAPASYSFATAGSKTLFAWAKDAAGNVSASRSASVTVTIQGTGLEPAGWYAGDMHVHRSCGGSPESITSLYQKMSPNSLSIISLLADMGNGEVQAPAQDLPRVNGQDDPLSTSGKTLHWDAEWHWDPIYLSTPTRPWEVTWWPWVLRRPIRFGKSTPIPFLTGRISRTASPGLPTCNTWVMEFPQSLTCCTPIEYPVETALGASDFISEDVADTGSSWSGMNPENAIQAYYRLLNCGFRPGLAAGTDYPCNNGRNLGSLLTYVHVADGRMTYRNWIDGIAKGRTVVSRNGHNEFLNLVVNSSATPGDEIRLTGGGTVCR